MASPGWYPDPAGRSGHFRYWDGTNWAGQTTTNPQQPPPGAVGPPLAAGRPAAGQNRPRKSPVRWIVILAVLIVLVLGVALMVRNIGGRDVVADPLPTASSTVSAWDETSTPSASAPQSPTSEPDSSTPPEGIVCPRGNPSQSSGQPSDGRVHGGRLSFAVIGAGYSDPAPEYMMSWMLDTQGQMQITEPGWMSMFAVGEVARRGHLATARQAAETSVQCSITNGWYSGFMGRKDLRNEAIKISEKEAWIISTEVRVTKPGLSVEGDLLTFIAVNDGRNDRLSVFAGMVPLGDQPRLALHRRVIDTLRVD